MAELQTAADAVNATRGTNTYNFKVVEYGKGDENDRILVGDSILGLFSAFDGVEMFQLLTISPLRYIHD